MKMQKSEDKCVVRFGTYGLNDLEGGRHAAPEGPAKTKSGTGFARASNSTNRCSVERRSASSETTGRHRDSPAMARIPTHTIHVCVPGSASASYAAKLDRVSTRPPSPSAHTNSRPECRELQRALNGATSSDA